LPSSWRRCSRPVRLQRMTAVIAVRNTSDTSDKSTGTATFTASMSTTTRYGVAAGGITEGTTVAAVGGGSSEEPGISIPPPYTPILIPICRRAPLLRWYPARSNIGTTAAILPAIIHTCRSVRRLGRPCRKIHRRRCQHPLRRRLARSTGTTATIRPAITLRFRGAHPAGSECPQRPRRASLPASGSTWRASCECKTGGASCLGKAPDSCVAQIRPWPDAPRHPAGFLIFKNRTARLRRSFSGRTSRSPSACPAPWCRPARTRCRSLATAGSAWTTVTKSAPQGGRRSSLAAESPAARTRCR
jgi:hypothetical protein